MDIYQQQKEKLLRLFDDMIAISKVQEKVELTARLIEEADRLRYGKLFTVVAGEFKQGKSSLIDALLDEPDLFPDNPDITTCLVSTISYAPQEKITVMIDESEDGSNKVVPRNIGRGEIRDYVMEAHNKKNMRQARLLKIESPNQHLKDGLVLVDTPGTGGLFKQHSEITYAFLPNADAILYVSDVLSPLSVQDLTFVQRIAGHCQRIIFVMTKTDLSNEKDYTAVMEGNRAKLVKVLNCASEDIHIVPVSSFFKLNYLKSGDDDDLTDSNFQALERELWSVLAQRGDILLKRALLVLGQAVVEVQAPLEAEKATLLHNPNVEAMKQSLQATKERLRQLDNNKSEWRMQLQRGVRSIERRMRNQFQQNFLNIGAKLDTYLDNSDLLKEPDAVLSMVEQDIYNFMVMLDKELNQQVAQLRSQVEKITSLGLSLPAITLINYTKPVPLAAPLTLQQLKKKLSWWDKLMIGMASGNREASGASVIGNVVGGALGLGVDIFTLGATGGGGLIVGAWLGGKIGKIAGYRSGIPHGLEDMRERELGEARVKVAQAARHFIDQSRVLCDGTIGESIEQIEQDITKEFLDLIDQERTTCATLQRTISDAQKLSQEEAQKRLLVLTPRLETVKRLEARLQQVANAMTPAVGPDDDNGDFADV